MAKNAKTTISKRTAVNNEASWKVVKEFIATGIRRIDASHERVMFYVHSCRADMTGIHGCITVYTRGNDCWILSEPLKKGVYIGNVAYYVCDSLPIAALLCPDDPIGVVRDGATWIASKTALANTLREKQHSITNDAKGAIMEMINTRNLC